MKKRYVLAATMLLTAGTGYAGTIAEKEAALAVRAAHYSEHPLNRYMTPTGSLALWTVLRTVKQRCRVASNFDKDDCVLQRTAAAEQLTAYGFHGVTSEHFRDAALFNLASELDRVFRAKKIALGNKAMRAPIPERKKYREAGAKLRRDSLEVNDHLIHGHAVNKNQ
jgi:hypothetical protein